MNSFDFTQIPGGVCAPVGFTAAGLHCGIAKKADKKDLALIVSAVPAVTAATYTTNKVKASPIYVTKEHLANSTSQAVLCNSGNANAVNADGYDVAKAMCASAAEALGIDPTDVVVASTGVIGQPLNVKPIQDGMAALAAALNDQGSSDAVHAIMTTDTVKKEIAIGFTIGGVACKMGAIAKGSGMIHPNMGTMLCFITTDVAIAPTMLQKALSAVVRNTFNMVSVDGDTSTNDMATVLANGLAGNTIIDTEGTEFDSFTAALTTICTYLSRLIAKDGEGATKLLTCIITNAQSEEAARILSKSVITSSLFKAAMFGADANWGRALCALGYADTDEFDPAKVDAKFVSRAGEVVVCQQGSSMDFSEELAKKILTEDEVELHINLNDGTGEAVAWGCDLTYDYVKINGDYRS